MKKKHWLALITALAAGLGSLMPGSPVPVVVQEVGTLIVGN